MSHDLHESEQKYFVKQELDIEGPEQHSPTCERTLDYIKENSIVKREPCGPENNASEIASKCKNNSNPDSCIINNVKDKTSYEYHKENIQDRENNLRRLMRCGSERVTDYLKKETFHNGGGECFLIEAVKHENLAASENDVKIEINVERDTTDCGNVSYVKTENDDVFNGTGVDKTYLKNTHMKKEAEYQESIEISHNDSTHIDGCNINDEFNEDQLYHGSDMSRVEFPIDIEEADIKEDVTSYTSDENLYVTKKLKTNRRLRKKTFSCDKCPYSTYHPDLLKNHKLKHKEKPYPCPDCGLKYATPTTLLRHSRTHTDRLFKCEKCSYLCYQLKEYQSHIAAHLSDIACTECSFICQNTEEMTQHCLAHKKDAIAAAERDTALLRLQNVVKRFVNVADKCDVQLLNSLCVSLNVSTKVQIAKLVQAMEDKKEYNSRKKNDGFDKSVEESRRKRCYPFCSSVYGGFKCTAVMKNAF